MGISDHTFGSTVPIAAAALGAVAVEKHVTFDRSQVGADHSFAMTMPEYADMISQLRNLELALGNGVKAPVESERAKQYRLRRGIYDQSTRYPASGDQGIWLRPQSQVSTTENA
ncbi:MAG: N,N'-diacetyllegionaminic acid synthase [Nitrosomonadaceae bacterium]|nr:N,N'-diacetyllegionaminic acid synthase [Nitrosomonadaceae bacterium]